MRVLLDDRSNQSPRTVVVVRFENRHDCAPRGGPDCGIPQLLLNFGLQPSAVCPGKESSSRLGATRRKISEVRLDVASAQVPQTLVTEVEEWLPRL